MIKLKTFELNDNLTWYQDRANNQKVKYDIIFSLVEFVLIFKSRIMGRIVKSMNKIFKKMKLQ